MNEGLADNAGPFFIYPGKGIELHLKQKSLKSKKTTRFDENV